MSALLSVELTLPGVTASVPSARRFVRSTLASWDLQELVDAATLVVSELATNAVLHARSDFTVVIAVEPGGALRLEVADGSQAQPAPRRYSNGATTGRGLSIVDDLAVDWGVDTTPRGKRVWVQLLSDHRARRASVPPEQGSGGPGPRRPVDPGGPTVLAA